MLERWAEPHNHAKGEFSTRSKVEVTTKMDEYSFI
jgi:hypothetical protein